MTLSDDRQRNYDKLRKAWIDSAQAIMSEYGKTWYDLMPADWRRSVTVIPVEDERVSVAGIGGAQ